MFYMPISDWISIQQLDLGCTTIGSDGAVALADALNFCPILKALDFGGNNIG